jgi:aquaporin Z
MDMPRRLGAEFFGTFWLTFAGCGSAVLAAGFPALGIGFLGVSLAFGLTVLTMAYAVGHVSGGHFNCAVTIGLWAGGRFKASDVIPYLIAQVAGAIFAVAVLYAIASGKPDWVAGGFASNGFGDLSPGKYGLVSCLFSEVIAAFFFLYVIIGTTSKGAAVGFAGIPIGLCLNSSAGGSTIWLTPHRRDASRLKCSESGLGAAGPIQRLAHQRARGEETAALRDFSPVYVR